ncbi:hypothetical protein JD844_018676 [Phrynosoma platyrhinos]|uniref:Uncharacterized protein n=1 Tax=Phrynosoma platyrhinos TaxID=52577 RepID=A0ABQ7SNY8_PHRPL|nr:hypothetical protein JD844_018676 [Phrynosoma platyrhinos]
MFSTAATKEGQQEVKPCLGMLSQTSITCGTAIISLPGIQKEKHGPISPSCFCSTQQSSHPSGSSSLPAPPNPSLYYRLRALSSAQAPLVL